jgi:plasmid stabilization system protein ParE
LKFQFKVAPRAGQQIRAAAGWWLKNRTKNPTAFIEELESAFLFIQELPYAGEIVRHRTIPNLRRVLLGLSQHYLYYSANAEEETVEVLALWHTSRGSAPKF